MSFDYVGHSAGVRLHRGTLQTRDENDRLRLGKRPAQVTYSSNMDCYTLIINVISSKVRL
jgi:hypothetical protein